MDAKARIRELMAERKWSEYRLAIASGLSQSTVANIFNRNTTPSVATLESICAGFGITLAQFFAEGEMVELTEEQREMFSAWSTLTKEQKEALQQAHIGNEKMIRAKRRPRGGVSRAGVAGNNFQMHCIHSMPSPASPRMWKPRRM